MGRCTVPVAVRGRWLGERTPSTATVRPSAWRRRWWRSSSPWRTSASCRLPRANQRTKWWPAKPPLPSPPSLLPLRLWSYYHFYNYCGRHGSRRRSLATGFRHTPPDAYHRPTRPKVPVLARTRTVLIPRTSAKCWQTFPLPRFRYRCHCRYRYGHRRCGTLQMIMLVVCVYTHDTSNAFVFETMELFRFAARALFVYTLINCVHSRYRIRWWSTKTKSCLIIIILLTCLRPSLKKYSYW